MYFANWTEFDVILDYGQQSLLHSKLCLVSNQVSLFSDVIIYNITEMYCIQRERHSKNKLVTQTLLYAKEMLKWKKWVLKLCSCGWINRVLNIICTNGNWFGSLNTCTTSHSLCLLLFSLPHFISMALTQYEIYLISNHNHVLIYVNFFSIPNIFVNFFFVYHQIQLEERMIRFFDNLTGF